MKTENKIVIILFLMAFSTVFLLYAVISADHASWTSAGENAVIPTVADVGKTVYAEGLVMSKKMTFKGEHLIVQMECDDHTVLPVFIPKSSGASAIYSKVDVDRRIGVKGSVEEYNGSLEIVLKNENDFHILN
ncbi:hypothetical protein [Methanimicrococcus blatticola]|uniref:tRNA_anti-like n=1 Tax=Methanimicrococcus blatticola TaxID=91560 RepID=A0A484F6S3_9EURY|nr:hypothetical protein [Methanimicrococcus blatticola]MBZ3934987.1 hypothetical protein [Methanimicrococcus blatticola]MCC2508915.1 hypothetical protein [Methanimicrococcus blatticola]TDQ71058.1 hypothetical protein C7391_0157 [Methanimicrococcus blatticola]